MVTAGFDRPDLEAMLRPRLDTLHIRVERENDRAVDDDLDVEPTTAVARMPSALGIAVTAVVEPPVRSPAGRAAS